MRISIARTLSVALTALTIVLAVVAGAGVASLYRARQRYERTLAQTSELSTAVANLTSASITEDEVLRDASGPAAGGERRSATAAFDAAAAEATAAARSDPISARLVAAQVATQNRARRLASTGHSQTATTSGSALTRSTQIAARTQARQRMLERRASSRAQSQSHNAIVLVIVAGALALIGALILIAALVHSMRRPLDDLVAATRGLAAGELGRRVRPSGPRELRDLGVAFNAMGEDLASAQSQIEAERRRLAVTIESLGDALLVTEPGSSTIATTNPRAAELVPELTPGQAVDDPRSPLPPLEVALARETVIDHGGRTLAIIAAPLGSADAGVVWTVRDTTERARLERAKTEFVATASHELRSPLTSIKGFVELLERTPENMSARQREFIDIVLRSTDRLVELVNDLLDVAQIEADSFEISPPADRHRRGGARRRRADGRRGPRQAPGVGGVRGSGDAARDGRPGSHPPGRRQPADERPHVHREEGPDSCRRRGRQGVGQNRRQRLRRGMTNEELERVFERFYRAHGASASVPGTGLGLSIVKSLIELHEGKIEVESELGRGTTFYVYSPGRGRQRAAPGARRSFRGRRV